MFSDSGLIDGFRCCCVRNICVDLAELGKQNIKAFFSFSHRAKKIVLGITYVRQYVCMYVCLYVLWLLSILATLFNLELLSKG